MHALACSCSRHLVGCGCRACRQGRAPGGKPCYVNPTPIRGNGCRKNQPFQCGMYGLVDGAVGSLQRTVCVLDVTSVRRHLDGVLYNFQVGVESRQTPCVGSFASECAFSFSAADLFLTGTWGVSSDDIIFNSSEASVRRRASLPRCGMVFMPCVSGSGVVRCASVV